MRNETIADIVARAIPENALPEQWDIAGAARRVPAPPGLDLPLADWAKEEGIAGDEIEERIVAAADRKMAEKTANYGADLMRMAEKSLLLQFLDQIWKDHLLQLDHLRQGINLRAYAQRDPLNEYKREAFELFEAMLAIVSAARRSAAASAWPMPFSERSMPGIRPDSSGPVCAVTAWRTRTSRGRRLRFGFSGASSPLRRCRPRSSAESVHRLRHDPSLPAGLALRSSASRIP